MKRKLLAVLLALTGSVLIIFSIYSLIDQNRQKLTELSKSITGFPHAYIVQSGSMEPAIKTGSIVIVLPFSTYKNGDIITFGKEGKNSNLITHRVMTKYYPDGIEKSPAYFTSGDANEDFDNGSIAHEEIVGKAIVAIPYLGYVANQAKQPYGFLLLVIVPATIIIYEEIKNLLKESFAFIKGIFIGKKKKQKNSDQDHYDNSNQHSKYQRLSLRSDRSIISYVLVAFIPLLGASLVLTGLAISFFSDSETSQSNVLQASEFFCNTSENANLVINEVFYDVDTVHNGQGSENKWEWVELFNPSTSPIDISGWIIEDGNSSDTFPLGITEIPPCGFAVVSNASETELEDQTNDGGQWTIPDVTIFVTLSSFIGNGLANGGDIVILKNAGSTEQDRMSFGTKLDGFTPNCVGSCPSVASGHSLEREPDGSDTGGQGDFFDKTIPSPGS